MDAATPGVIAVLRRCLFTVAIALLGLLGSPAPGLAETRVVAVTAIIEHPALDATRRGITDELRAAGYAPGENLELVFASARGSHARAERIARELVELSPDVIVPLSTPSAQAVARATSTIPVVFAAVTDPLGAGLVDDLAHPGGNVTGMSDLSPIDAHVDLITRIVPDARRLGVIYNPDEANAARLLELLGDQAPAHDLALVPAPVSAAAEVADAAAGLVGRADAIYVPTDNTVITALEAIAEVGRKNRLPVFAGDVHAVPRGAIAASGFNYYDLGRQTGRMVRAVLDGTDPGAMPVQRVSASDLFVNLAAADAMGVRVPGAVLERAKTIIERVWASPPAGAGTEAAK